MERDPNRFSRREFNHKILCVATGVVSVIVGLDGAQKFFGLNGVADAAMENPESNPKDIMRESRKKSEVDTKLRQVVGMAQIYLAVQSLSEVRKAVITPVNDEQN